MAVSGSDIKPTLREAIILRIATKCLGMPTVPINCSFRIKGVILAFWPDRSEMASRALHSSLSPCTSQVSGQNAS